jgi:hypothetical protein
VNNQVIKIGISDNPEKRRRDLEMNGCYHLSIVATIDHLDVRDERELEKALHDKFSKYRIKGEWFEYNDEIIGHARKLTDKGLAVWHEAGDLPETQFEYDRRVKFVTGPEIMKRLEKEREIAIEALEFYADQSKYDEIMVDNKTLQRATSIEIASRIEKDRGAVALAALKRIMRDRRN